MSFSRAMAFLLVGWAALLVTSVTTALTGAERWVPDVTLVIVLYLAVATRGQGSASSGALVALSLGYLTDLIAGAPRGLHAVTHVIVMLIMRAAAGRLLVTRTWQEVVVSLFVAVGHGALLIGLASPLYDGHAAQALADVPRSAFATALLATPLLFRILRAMDRKLSPERGGLRMPLV